MVDGEPGFDSMYLKDIEDDYNLGVHCGDKANTPMAVEYDNMHTDEKPEDDNEEAVDKYLNVELLMDV